MDARNRARNLKFCIIGDEGVGKSKLMRRCIHNSYEESKHRSTIAVDFGLLKLQIAQQLVKVELWDCAGEYSYLRQQKKQRIPPTYHGANAYIIVFDLANRPSFNNIIHYLESAIKANPSAIFMLVGNKVDDNLNRKVLASDVTDLLKNPKFHFHAYLETSAKTGDKVHDLFLVTVKYAFDPARAKLIADLIKYVARIESYKYAGSITINFASNFWFNSQSRSINREANYLLAKRMLHRLQNTDESLASITVNIPNDRLDVILKHNLRSRSGYVERRIGSWELNSVIRKLKSI